MSRSRKFLALDSRRRITLGDLAHYDVYVATVDENKVITLTPQELVPVIRPVTRRRTPRKKPGAPAGKPVQEQTEGPTKP